MSGSARCVSFVSGVGSLDLVASGSGVSAVGCSRGSGAVVFRGPVVSDVLGGQNVGVVKPDVGSDLSGLGVSIEVLAGSSDLGVLGSVRGGLEVTGCAGTTANCRGAARVFLVVSTAKFGCARPVAEYSGAAEIFLAATTTNSDGVCAEGGWGRLEFCWRRVAGPVAECGGAAGIFLAATTANSNAAGSFLGDLSSVGGGLEAVISARPIAESGRVAGVFLATTTDNSGQLCVGERGVLEPATGCGLGAIYGVLRADASACGVAASSAGGAGSCNENYSMPKDNVRIKK
ncbi:hypothetical protein ACOSQ3_029015 [Xanthoceras sorbifolium]